MRKLVLILICLWAGLTPALASDEALGWWGGTISYRGDNLDVRIHITRDQDGDLTGRLDMPALVYANEMVPIMEEEEISLFTVDYPFGLGEIPYSADGYDRMVGTRISIESVLTRIPAPPYRKQDVSFHSVTGDIEGTLYMPRGAGPFPAIVLAAGASNAERVYWSYSSWADYYARLGIAAFIYDRTEDDYVLDGGTVTNLEVQAEEFADAVRFVQSQSNITNTQVGVAGTSRGAWLAMYAAAEVEDVAFAVLSSGSPLTPGEQTIVEVRTKVYDATRDWDLVSDAEAYMRLYFYVAKTGHGWDTLAEEVERVIEGPLHGIVDEPRAQVDLTWWGRNLDFQPQPLLANITVPVLGMWGGIDLVSPPQVNAPLMESYLPGGADQLTTHIYPYADHRLELPLGESVEGVFSWFAVAPIAENDIEPWLRSIGILN